MQSVNASFGSSASHPACHYTTPAAAHLRLHRGRSRLRAWVPFHGWTPSTPRHGARWTEALHLWYDHAGETPGGVWLHTHLVCRVVKFTRVQACMLYLHRKRGDWDMGHRSYYDSAKTRILRADIYIKYIFINGSSRLIDCRHFQLIQTWNQEWSH